MLTMGGTADERAVVVLQPQDEPTLIDSATKDGDQRSSSPAQLFSSPPCISSVIRKRSIAVCGTDDEADADDMSRPTTLPSDGDDGDDDEEEEKDDDDDITFLQKFRERQIQQKESSDGTPRGSQAVSSLFSGSLSDPPSSLTRSADARVDSLLALSDSTFSGALSDVPSSLTRSIFALSADVAPLKSPSSSSDGSEVYQTEAQKEAEEAERRRAREERIRQLAARTTVLAALPGVHKDTAVAAATAEAQEARSSTIDEDEISSSSDLDDSASALLKSARPLTVGAQRYTGREAVGRKALEMEASDVDSVLSDLEPAATSNDKSAAKPLTKRDLEEMNRMQARIEREKKLALVKSAAVASRERKHFGLSELIHKVGVTESARPGLTPSRAVAKRSARHDSPSSDPIESSSSSEMEVESRPKGEAGKADAHPTSQNRRLFYHRIREKYPAGALDALVDEEGREDETKAREGDESNTQWKLWQEKKKAALREMPAMPSLTVNSTEHSVTVKSTSLATKLVEEDDFELFDVSVKDYSKEKRGSPLRSSLTEVTAIEPRQTKLSSHLARRGDRTGITERGPSTATAKSVDVMLNAANPSPVSDSEKVTVSQVQRAGLVFGPAGPADKKPQSSPQTDMDQKAKMSQTSPAKGSTNPRFTRNGLHRFLNEQVAEQNMRSRQKRQGEAGKRSKLAAISVHDEEKESVGDMLKRLAEQAQKSALFPASHDDAEADDEEEADSEFDPADQDHDSLPAVGLGSASEEESEDGGEEDEDDGETSIASLSLEQRDASKETAFNIGSAPPTPETVKTRNTRRNRRMIVEDDEDDDNAILKDIDEPEEIENESLANPIAFGDLHTSPSDQAALAVSNVSGADLSPFPALSSSSNALAQFFAPTPEAGASSPAELCKMTDGSSNSSAFGPFFQDTQTDRSLRGESFQVLRNEDAERASFSQLFERGSPSQPTTKTRSLMPPPTTSAKGLSLIHGSEDDGFAALRKAQESAALLVDDEPLDLPALEDILRPDQEDEIMALELEAVRAEEEERLSRLAQRRAEDNVTYINKEGFFTQTRPESFSFGPTQSQGQSQGILRALGRQSEGQSSEHLEEERDEQDDDDNGNRHNDEHGTSSAIRQKRFRRAAWQVSKDANHGAAKAPAGDDEQGGQADSDEEQDKESVLTVAKPGRTAFDVMKDAAANANKDKQADRISEVERASRRFLEGEAEESDGDSDDEIGLLRRKRRERGGLEGVFSDDEAGKSEEGEDDDDDGQDLEDLIDEEKDVDEAEKDVLARERYLKDREEDDRAALALHERATRGVFRHKRRARNGEDGALDGLLDEDYEEDYLEKAARNPYGAIAKKRRLDGKDGMDLLAESEESQAFVREYRDSHQDDYELDSYTFLLAQDEDDNDGNDDAEEKARRLLHDLHEGGVEGAGQSDNDDGDQSGDDGAHDDEKVHPIPQRVSRRQIEREIIAARRMQRRQRPNALQLSDDDDVDEEDERRRAEAQKRQEQQLLRTIERACYGNADDDDDDNLPDTFVHDSRQFTTQRATRNDIANAAISMQPDDDNEGELAFGLPGLGSTHAATTERERARLARLARDFEHEPDWSSVPLANHRVRHVPSRSAAAASISRPITSRFNHGEGPSTTFPLQTTGTRIASRLQGVLSRQGHFTEAQ